jgi:hypothetical protein
MPEFIVPSMLKLSRPGEIPGLVSFWHFATSSDTFPATEGESLSLVSMSGPLDVLDDPTAPLGGKALDLKEGQWLNLPRRQCPALNFGGSRSPHTLVAWIRRGRIKHRGCEFIAGMWNESQMGRQYGLFLNISVWGQTDQICGHLSRVGGPTPGFKFCTDGPVGLSPIPHDAWSVIALSYDNLSGYAWLNGNLDIRPGLNPYSMAGGLFDGGEKGSDFTVGAVNRSGEIGNFYAGCIAGIAAYNRALTPAEIFALSTI